METECDFSFAVITEDNPSHRRPADRSGDFCAFTVFHTDFGHRFSVDQNVIAHVVKNLKLLFLRHGAGKRLPAVERILTEPRPDAFMTDTVICRHPDRKSRTLQRAVAVQIRVAVYGKQISILGRLPFNRGRRSGKALCPARKRKRRQHSERPNRNRFCDRFSLFHRIFLLKLEIFYKQA